MFPAPQLYDEKCDICLNFKNPLALIRPVNNWIFLNAEDRSWLMYETKSKLQKICKRCFLLLPIRRHILNIYKFREHPPDITQILNQIYYLNAYINN